MADQPVTSDPTSKIKDFVASKWTKGPCPPSWPTLNVVYSSDNTIYGTDNVIYTE